MKLKFLKRNFQLDLLYINLEMIEDQFLKTNATMQILRSIIEA